MTDLRVDYELRFGSGMRIGFDTRRGSPVELSIDRAPIGRLNIIPFHLEIVDELERRSYSEIELPHETVLASQVRAEPLPEGVLFRKTYPGAPFTVDESWRIVDADLVWSVEVVPVKEIRPRSLAIRQFFPNPQRTQGHCWWQVWTARAGYPCSFFQAIFSRIHYGGDPNVGTPIPILCLYDAGQNLGVSLAKPLGLRVPCLCFCFDDCRNGGVTVESSAFKLGDGASPRAELLIHTHEGDWRPGLAWFARKYPAYFRPGNPLAAERIDGPFAGGTPTDTAQTADCMVRYGARAVEIHLHYACYGNYFPEEEKWVCREEPLPELLDRELSVETVRETIRMYTGKGILPLLYIQLAGDGYKPYVEKEFPESIARTAYGHGVGVDRYNVWLMNSDLSLPFGRHIAKRLERFFELYGDAGGLFWDQPCYDGFDFTHHDGVTMVDNRPAYRLAFCYGPHRDRMVEEAHRRGMFVSSNTPVYIELAEGLDQIMSEGLVCVHSVKYLCIERPMIVWGEGETAAEAELAYQTCLLAGAACPYAPGKPVSSEVEEVIFAYQPLLLPLRGRRWLLEADPLKLPPGTEGNIFRRPDDTVCITLVRRLPAFLRNRPLTFEAAFAGVGNVRKASYLVPGAKAWRDAQLSVEGGRAKITLPGHAPAAVVVVE